MEAFWKTGRVKHVTSLSWRPKGRHKRMLTLLPRPRSHHHESFPFDEFKVGRTEIKWHEFDYDYQIDKCFKILCSFKNCSTYKYNEIYILDLKV